MKIILGGVISLPPVSTGLRVNRLQYVLGLRFGSGTTSTVEESSRSGASAPTGDRVPTTTARTAARSAPSRSGSISARRSCQIYDGGEDNGPDAPGN